MKVLKIVIVLTAALFFSATFLCCGSDTGEVSVKDVAKTICNCAEPNMKINKEIEAKMGSGNVDEATQLFKKAELTLEESVKCSKELYHEKIQKEELKKTLISTCGMNEAQASVLVERMSE